MTVLICILEAQRGPELQFQGEFCTLPASSVTRCRVILSLQCEPEGREML
jgi:hypothetical protein